MINKKWVLAFIDTLFLNTYNKINKKEIMIWKLKIGCQPISKYWLSDGINATMTKKAAASSVIFTNLSLNVFSS
jgi:hypothetical protein